jgi:HSP20 family protein
MGRHMNKEVSRFLRSFFDAKTEPYGNTCWCPAADVYRGRAGWLIKFDLAGVRAEDIRLRIDGARVTLEGIRRDYSILDDQQAFSMEIAYNRFRRSVELPCDVQDCEISSEYRDGMFLVVIMPGSRQA